MINFQPSRCPFVFDFSLLKTAHGAAPLGLWEAGFSHGEDLDRFREQNELETAATLIHPLGPVSGGCRGFQSMWSPIRRAY